MTKILMDGQEVEEFHVHFIGENFVWLEGITKEGKRIQTLCLRGEV